MARAVDKWAGSVAVWGSTPKNLVTWAIVDQLLATNKSLYREADGGFRNPGIFTVVIDRPGDFTVYHGDIFLGALRTQNVILHEVDAFNSPLFVHRVAPRLTEIASAICKAVPGDPVKEDVFSALLESWASTVAHICIGLRRIGTGGSLLLTAKPKSSVLNVGHHCKYDRLRSSFVLRQVDAIYKNHLIDTASESQTLNRQELSELWWAESDLDDRVDEMAGASKVVTSLASMDGAVLMTLDLSVTGFGVKIGSAPEVKIVYDGEDFSIKGKRAKRVSVAELGTRHASVLRYCSVDSNAIGVVISQDGQVRIVHSVDGAVVMWSRIKLLNQQNYSEAVALRERRHRAAVTMAKKEHGSKKGFSPMPKTFSALMSGDH